MTFKITKKLLVLFLSLLLLLSLLPITVLAYDEPVKSQALLNNDEMKKAEDVKKSEESEESLNDGKVDKDSYIDKTSSNQENYQAKVSENTTKIQKKGVLRVPTGSSRTSGNARNKEI